MVIFAIVSSLLFVVVVILFVHYEKPCCPISETKKRKDEDDRSSLLEITHIEHNINLQQVSYIDLRTECVLSSSQTTLMIVRLKYILITIN